MTVQSARAQQLIAAAQSAYIHEIDDGDCTLWPDFFVDDCFYQITSADNFADGLEAGIVWLDSKAMLQDRILSLYEANIYERHSYRHLLGQPYISSIDGNVVHSQTGFMVARITREGPTDLFATGRYVDRWRLDEGATLIEKRIVVLDSNRIDTLLGFPL